MMFGHGLYSFQYGASLGNPVGFQELPWQRETRFAYSIPHSCIKKTKVKVTINNG